MVAIDGQHFADNNMPVMLNNNKQTRYHYYGTAPFCGDNNKCAALKDGMLPLGETAHGVKIILKYPLCGYIRLVNIVGLE